MKPPTEPDTVAARAAQQEKVKAERDIRSAESALALVRRGRRQLVEMIIAGTDLSTLSKREVASITGKAPAAVRDEDLDTLKSQMVPVQRDYQTVQKTLGQLNLKLWGGSGPGESFTSFQSWQAESSGVPQRTDDVTERFQRHLKSVSSGGGPKSMVVLAHDVSGMDVDEVGRDVLKMEDEAKKHGTRVEYYTMSGLFRCLRRQEPGPRK